MFGLTNKDLNLLWVFFSMNVRDKYLGSRLGSFWAVANPLIMMGLFTFVFGFVLQMKAPGAETSLSYAIWLISGYGPWIATVEGLVAAALSVVANGGLIKNMAFKVELLPVAAGLTGLLPLVVSLVFLSVLLLIDGQSLTVHALFGVVIVILQFGFIVSLGFLMSAITVFIRDFAIALPNLLMMVLFATPILYPLSLMPQSIQILSYVNPFYIISDGYRRALLYQQGPDLMGVLLVGGLTLFLFSVGLKMFRKRKVYFETRL